MTIHIYLDQDLVHQVSEGDYSNPDRETFNGTDGETKDGRLFLANEQVALASAVAIDDGTVALAAPGFSGTEIIIIGSEQMRILAGAGTSSLNVERGYGGTSAQAHAAGERVFSGYDYTEVVVEAIDTGGTDETQWVRLAINQGDLDAAVAGESLTLGEKSHDQTLSFWRRITVPAATPVQNKTDLRLRVTALENPIL